jgi:hypothetical protein
MRLYRLIAAVIFVACLALPAAAQNFTAVSGTITDPNGVPYSNCAVTAELVPSGTNPTIGGAGISGLNRASCDANGSFSMTLGSNAVISPGGTQWKFTVTETGSPLPLGTGPQTCIATIAVSGASQSISGNFSCPALGRSASSSSAPAVRQGIIVLDPTCPTVATPNCFFWNGDVRIYADTTLNNGSNIVTISGGDTPFTSTETLNNGTVRPWIKVGQRIMCSTDNLLGTMVLGNVSTGVTVTSIDSATQIHVSANATANQVANARCAIGDVDTPNILNYWNNGLISQCGPNGYISQGIGFIDKGVFNSITAACQQKFVNQYSEPGLFGAGLGATTLMPLETFDFTTGAGNSCQGGVGGSTGPSLPSGNRSACIGDFFSEMTWINVWGLGLTPTNSVAAPVSLVAGNSRFNSDSLQGWMGNYTGANTVYGHVLNGNQVIVNQGCACQFGEVSLWYNGQGRQAGNFVFGGITSVQVGSATNGAKNAMSEDSFIGPTNGNAGGAEIVVNSGMNFVEVGDQVSNASGNLAAHYMNAGGTSTVIGSALSIAANGAAFRGAGAGSVTRVTDTSAIGGGNTAYTNMAAGATFIDQCGNTVTSFTNGFTGAGNIAGSCSADLAPCATGNWALTSGWGTSSVASVGAQGTSHKCRVNITGAAGAAGPVLTWTFPTPYPVVAPSTCHIFQTGGTTFNLTNATSSTPTTTSVAFTFVGQTPTAQAYSFDVDCG